MAQPRSLADRLEWLFQHHKNPNTGKSYTNQQLADRVKEMTGVSLSPPAIWNLRRGVSKDSSFETIKGLAKAFGVTPLFFSDDSPDVLERTEEELAVLAAMRRVNVRNLCLRADDLPDEMLEHIQAMVEQVHQLIGERKPSRASRKDEDRDHAAPR